ncbi:MAG: MCP four helix bundle domain-containing protein, partial [Oscillospiraceae bacterium]
MFKNLSISKRLLLVALSMGFFAISIAAITMFSLYGTNTNLMDLKNNPYTANAAVKNSLIEVNNIARIVRDLTIQTDSSQRQAYIDDIQKSQNNIESSIRQLNASYVVNDGLNKQYGEAIMTWKRAADSIIQNINAGDIETANRMLLTDCPQALSKVTQLAGALNTYTDNLVSRTIGKNITHTNTILIVAGSILVFALIFCTLLSRSVRIHIMNSINEINNMAQAMSVGNLNLQTDYQSKDELGTLATNIRSAISTMREYVDNISIILTTISDGDMRDNVDMDYIGDFAPIKVALSSITHSLNDTFYKINHAANQVASGADQVSGAAQTLAQGATEQASAIEELSASIMDVTNQVTQNAQNSNQANEKANGATLAVASS